MTLLQLTIQYRPNSCCHYLTDLILSLVVANVSSLWQFLRFKFSFLFCFEVCVLYYFTCYMLLFVAVVVTTCTTKWYNICPRSTNRKVPSIMRTRLQKREHRSFRRWDQKHARSREPQLPVPIAKREHRPIGGTENRVVTDGEATRSRRQTAKSSSNVDLLQPQQLHQVNQRGRRRLSSRVQRRRLLLPRKNQHWRRPHHLMMATRRRTTMSLYLGTRLQHFHHPSVNWNCVIYKNPSLPLILMDLDKL